MISALSPHLIYCYFCTYGTFVFYIHCLRRLKRQRRQVVDRNVANSLFNKQVQVFWHALLIWLSLVTSLTSSRLLPLINNDILYTVINTVFSLCCQYGIPIIPVIFSKDIRKMLKRLILKDCQGSMPLNM
uniref:Vomeronasal type-1 receptor n=1 Tax=Romanomermis culicivorax TaxID=13658 RepID=A0A915KZB1_ROMCU